MISRMRYLLFLCFTLTGAYSLQAQDMAVGEWRTHLPYMYGNTVVEAGNLVYCGTRSGLYSYNKTTGDMRKYSKVDGFSGVGVTVLEYNQKTQTVFIVYDDANIDLLKGDEIVNMSQIRDYPITGEKTIHAVTMAGDSAILSCAFGIVIIDVRNEVVKTDVKFSDDIAFLGKKCYDAAIFNSRYYFGTSDGVYSVGLNQNVKNLSNWTPLTGISGGAYNTMVTAFNKLYFNYSDKITQNLDNSDTLYSYDGVAVQRVSISNTTIHHLNAGYGKLTVLHPASLRVLNSSETIIQDISGCFDKTKDAVPGSNGEYWIASGYGGFFGWKNGECGFYTLDGPFSEHTYDMLITDGNIFVASGAVTQQWNNVFRVDGMFYRLNNDWKGVPIPDFGFSFPHMDIHTVAADPVTPGHYIAGSWGTGFYEVSNYNIATQLTGAPFDPAPNGAPYRLGGVAIDEDGNWWVSNAYSPTPLKRRNSQGIWVSYNFDSAGLTGTYLAGKITIDDFGYIWMAAPGRGIAILDPQTNSRRWLRDSYNYGDLPNTYVRAIVKDLNGEIWVGTENGIRTFSSSQIFPTSNAVNGQKIVIKAEDGNNELLLNETVINDIEVDGANRKWIATEGSGVRLVSDDGREILRSFTAENSPLLSNNVKCIAIDNQSGEVYFGTEKGIISFRSDATVGNNSFGEVYAFPNPVKPEYEGPIVIKGMANDALVKITDIAGNLVYETTSLGGQAVWDGKRFDGKRPQTGVYLVFCVNEDASETVITKILFIN